MKNLEPMTRFELATCSLRKSCSTPELHRPFWKETILPASNLWVLCPPADPVNVEAIENIYLRQTID